MWLGGSSSSCWIRSPRSVDHLDAASLEEGAHVAFLGEHRLAFDEGLGAAFGEDVVDDLVVLGGVAGPVHLDAIRGRVALERLEIAGEVRKRVLLDPRGELAQRLPFRDVMRLAVALLT